MKCLWNLPDKSNRLTCLGLLARFGANCGPVCKNSPKQMHFTVIRNYQRMNCDTLNEGNARWSLIRSEPESGALNPMFLALFGFHADLWLLFSHSVSRYSFQFKPENLRDFSTLEAEGLVSTHVTRVGKRLNCANKFQTLTRFKPQPRSENPQTLLEQSSENLPHRNQPSYSQLISH